MVGSIVPEAPFAGEPPHYVDRALGYAVWFTEPAGVVGRLLEPRIVDHALVDLVTGPLHVAVRSIAGDGRRTHAVHDWSLATGYEPSTRQALTGWLLAHRHELAAMGVIAPKEDRLIRVGADVARTVMLVAGSDFRLYDDLAHAARALGLSRRAGEVEVLRGASR
jgi:hypothetical protein